MIPGPAAAPKPAGRVGIPPPVDLHATPSSEPPQNAPAPPGTLRDRILETAVDTVETRGVDGLTMRSLADRLGYSPATLYLHYRNKGALLEAVASAGFEALDGKVDLAIRGEAAPRRALEAGVAAYLRFADASPRTYQLMFRCPAPEATRGGVRARLFGRFRDLLGAIGGPIRGAEEEALRTGWSLLHGRLELSAAGLLGGSGGPESAEILASEAVSLLLGEGPSGL